MEDMEDRERDNLWPLAQLAAKAVFLGTMGQDDQAQQAFREVAAKGPTHFFAAACAWASIVCPIEEGQYVSTSIIGPKAGEERVQRVAAFVAGVLNNDVEGVVALWNGFSVPEALEVGWDAFTLACAAGKPSVNN